jgi:hypothetical protein
VNAAAAPTSEMLVFYHSTTRRHNSEDFDSNLNQRENIKSSESQNMKEVLPVVMMKVKHAYTFLRIRSL